jgi:serine/threonine protein kinase
MISGIEWLINKEIGYLNIKPENILILKKNIKLIDYGIKFMINMKIINDFMSPELIKNQIYKK